MATRPKERLVGCHRRVGIVLHEPLGPADSQAHLHAAELSATQPTGRGLVSIAPPNWVATDPTC